MKFEDIFYFGIFGDGEVTEDLITNWEDNGMMSLYGTIESTIAVGCDTLNGHDISCLYDDAADFVHYYCQEKWKAGAETKLGALHFTPGKIRISVTVWTDSFEREEIEPDCGWLAGGYDEII
jgi:hypothetical protein